MNLRTLQLLPLWLALAEKVSRRESRRRAVADADLWTKCALASRVVGSGKYGLTAKTAERFGTSRDTVERMAAGYAIFDTLRKQDHRRAWEIRRRYNYGRFVEMGAVWMRYEFPPVDAMEYLESDLSDSAMVAEITDRHDPNPEWKRRFFGLSKNVLKLVDDDAPEPIKEWARAGSELFRQYSVNK